MIHSVAGVEIVFGAGLCFVNGASREKSSPHNKESVQVCWFTEPLGVIRHSLSKPLKIRRNGVRSLEGENV